ncbi:MAG: glutathione S-transferase family protein [Acidobacteriota bacterium]
MSERVADDGLILYIGSKSYSSWSLRPWLTLKQAGAAFSEMKIALHRPDTEERVRAVSPSGYVPLLKEGGLLVWGSLSICEYVAERFPAAGLWPADRAARAVARSVSAEMHAGFPELRKHLSFNCRTRLPGFQVPSEAREDADRVLTLWTDLRARFGKEGPFLFGSFSVADAMYAPVVLRFQTYDVKLEGASAAYASAVLELPAVRQWIAEARLETE